MVLSGASCNIVECTAWLIGGRFVTTPEGVAQVLLNEHNVKALVEEDEVDFSEFETAGNGNSVWSRCVEDDEVIILVFYKVCRPVVWKTTRSISVKLWQRKSESGRWQHALDF